MSSGDEAVGRGDRGDISPHTDGIQAVPLFFPCFNFFIHCSISCFFFTKHHSFFFSLLVVVCSGGHSLFMVKPRDSGTQAKQPAQEHHLSICNRRDIGNFLGRDNGLAWLVDDVCHTDIAFGIVNHDGNCSEHNEAVHRGSNHLLLH